MGARTFVRANRCERARPRLPTLLQWGRALSYAQMSFRRFSYQHGAVASMGARTFVRANLLWPSDAARADTGFNGGAHFRTRKCSSAPRLQSSTTSLQWGRALSYAQIISSSRPETGKAPASMGARTFVRANVKIRSERTRRGLELQWGRALSYAQILRGRRSQTGVHLASMGARTFVRANSFVLCAPLN